MKKHLLLIIIPIAVLLVLGLVLLILNLTTDIFKSPSEMFWKYIVQNADIVDILENDKQVAQKNIKESNSYTSTGNLLLTMEQGENNIKQINVDTTARYDVNTGRTYADATLKNGELDIFNVSYINSGDIYAIECVEVTPVYIGFRDGDFSSLVAKYGARNVDRLPDRVDLSEYEGVFDLTDEQKSHIINTYLPIITNIVQENQYQKMGESVQINGSTYDANIYRVQITGDNVKQILIQMLNTLQSDSETLILLSNKFSVLKMGINYTDISNFSLLLQRKIEELQNATIPDLIINVYENRGNVIRTSFEMEGIINVIYDRVQNYNSLTIDLEEDILNNVMGNIEETITSFFPTTESGESSNGENVPSDAVTDGVENSATDNTNANNEDGTTTNDENSTENSSENQNNENTETAGNDGNVVDENVTSGENTNTIESSNQNNGTGNEVIDLTQEAEDLASTTYGRISIVKQIADSASVTTIDFTPNIEDTSTNINIVANYSNIQNNSANNSFSITLSGAVDEIPTIYTISYDTMTTQASSVEEIPELTNSNTVLANNYEAEQFTTFFNNWYTAFMNAFSEKAAMIGIEVGTE